MSVKQLCQKYINNALKSTHATRRCALFDVSWALTQGARLSVTHLGRHLEGSAYVKHKIKRADRLLSNKHIQQELIHIYKELFAPILSSLSTINLAVDWSGYDGHDYHVIRASLLFEGRSIPIYNQVFAQESLGSQQAHELFLDSIQSILPENIPVIITTDAGFVTPWFSAIEKRGWYFVGRGKLETKHYCSETRLWRALYDYEVNSNDTPSYEGSGWLGKKSNTPVCAAVYTYKMPSKRRKGRSKYPDVNKRHSKQAEYGWVIVTNLAGGAHAAKRVIRLYKKRMQIEQNFRDDKSYRFGFGFRLTRVKNKSRIAVYCLLSAIATFLLWWIGITGEMQKTHWRFQANTVKETRVLSVITLAKQILRHCPDIVTKERMRQASAQFISLYNQSMHQCAY